MTNLANNIKEKTTRAIAIISMSFKEALAYKAMMFFSVVTMPISILVSYFIWTAIFAASNSDTIGGLALHEMISYYVISLLVITLTWNPIIQDLHRGVRKGEFIKFVIKPFSYPFYALFNALGGRALAFFIEFVPVLMVIGAALDVSYLQTDNLFLFVLSVTMAIIIYYFISLLIGSLIFWIVNPNGVTWIYRIARYLLAGGLIPLSFFPEAIQKVVLFLPFAYTNYVPVTVFIGAGSLGGVTFGLFELLFYGGLQILICGLLTYLVWSKAIEKFQGVGA